MNELAVVVIIFAASMPVWLKWGFWVSPLSYGEIGLSVNEFLAPRWQKVSCIKLHCFSHDVSSVS